MIKVNSLPTEESEKIKTFLDKVLDQMDEEFGKNNYSCYLNVVWKRDDNPNPLSISATSKNQNEDKDGIWLKLQSMSLAEDSFVKYVVLSHAFNKLMETGSELDPNYSFNSTAKDEDIN